MRYMAKFSMTIFIICRRLPRWAFHAVDYRYSGRFAPYRRQCAAFVFLLHIRPPRMRRHAVRLLYMAGDVELPFIAMIGALCYYAKHA